MKQHIQKIRIKIAKWILPKYERMAVELVFRKDSYILYGGVTWHKVPAKTYITSGMDECINNQLKDK